MMSHRRLKVILFGLPWAIEAEFFGDDGEGGGGGFADAEREMSGGAAHADDEIPARGGAGIFREVAHGADAVMPGGLEAERRRRAGQRQIVVNGLGHVGDADVIAGVLETADRPGWRCRRCRRRRC